MGGYHDEEHAGSGLPPGSDADELEPFELVAAPLVLLAPPVVPSPGLFDRIAAAAGITAGLPGYYVCRSDEGGWQPVADGVDVRVLHRGGPGERRTILMRLQPGSTVGAHHHASDEECFVIDGEVVMGGIVFARGDFLIARGGTDHPPVTSPSGSLLLISTQVPITAAHP